MAFVIVGGGLAGASAVEELREQGYDGDVVLLGAEPHLPYHRPPLSKEVLLGKESADGTDVHDAQWYADRRVDVRTGTAARRIDREHQVVETDEGRCPTSGCCWPRDRSRAGCRSTGRHTCAPVTTPAPSGRRCWSSRGC